MDEVWVELLARGDDVPKYDSLPVAVDVEFDGFGGIGVGGDERMI